MNGTTSGGGPVPYGASVQWLLSAPSWDFFDVAHLHSVELVGYEALDRLAGRLRKERKGLVFTAHDLLPAIDPDPAEFARKMERVLAAVPAVATLTPWARSELCARFGLEPGRVVVAPHGYVVRPGTMETAHVPPPLPRLCAYGALRPNRSLDALTAMWSHVMGAPGAFPAGLRLLVRSVSRDDLGRYPNTLARLTGLLCTGGEVEIHVTPRAVTDAEIVDLCRTSTALILPYRWTTHSGQLELAWDLGVPVLAPRTGGLPSQTTLHGEGRLPVCWFDPAWLDGPDHLTALASLVRDFLGACTESPERPAASAAQRLEEHRLILQIYGELYRSSAGAA